MCSLVLDGNRSTAYLAVMGNASTQLAGGHPVARIALVEGRYRAYPIASFRVSCHLGEGTLHYLTDDRWIGVHLDCEANPRRIDEVPVEQCTIVPVEGAAQAAAA
jgi:hypothetical protein